MDYFDILLAKKLSGGGGGGEITVEGLNVEENGTYTAPSGKAYSPVVVNLPLGEKAITANGEYNASADNLKGYSKVTVNVAGFKVKDMPTGAISSFDDGTDNPLRNLKVSIVPVQSGSGDPSPQNDRPISGWTGAEIYVRGQNIWNQETENGFYDVSTGVYRYDANYVCSKNNSPIYIKGYRTLYFYNGKGSGLPRIIYYDENGNFISSESFTTPSGVFTTPQNTSYIKFYMSTPYGTTYSNDISINYPSTDTSYHAYNGTTYPITFGQTVYGGELDVTSGSGVKTNDLITYDGSNDENWNLQSINQYDIANFYIPLTYNTSKIDEFMSDKLVRQTTPISTTQEEGYLPSGGVSLYLRLDKSKASTVAELRIWLEANPISIYFPLAESVGIDIIPTQINSLDGTNNIWVDCGDVISGKYFASL